jgi:polysaccharide pyruvyl transferase WcaK-like protein
VRIGLLGAWSIDNTGDNVLAWAARQAIGVRLPRAELLALAPEFAGSLWGHDFGGRGAGPIRSIPPGQTIGWTRGLDGVVIGGGGLVSFHPQFRCFQPGSRWPVGMRAVWNAVGSQNTAWYRGTREERRRLAASCERLAYVGVRSRSTARLLERCGYRGRVRIVPDPALGVELPGEDHTDTILDRAGADAGEPLIGVSVGTAIRDGRTKAFYDRLAAAIRALRMRAVVFPFGLVYGERTSQRAMAARLPGSLMVGGPIHPFDRWRLIGRMRLYIGCRFHAVLAAYAQNVPFLAVDEYLSDDIATSKVRELCAEEGLEAHWTCPYLPTDPAEKLRRIAADPPSFTTAVAALRRRLDRHHDALVTALTSGG